MRLLLFTIDDVRYAIRADAVLEIVRAVAVAPLPGAPSVIEGIIDLRGTAVPVFDLRRRFGLPVREVDVADQFVIARASTRVAALHVDRVLDLADVDAGEITHAVEQLPAARHIDGVVTMTDGMALIHELDRFLSAAESESLESALSAAPRN